MHLIHLLFDQTNKQNISHTKRIPNRMKRKKKQQHNIQLVWIHWRFTKHYIVIVIHRTTGFSTEVFQWEISYPIPHRITIRLVIIYVYIYILNIRSDNKNIPMHWIRHTTYEIVFCNLHSYVKEVDDGRYTYFNVVPEIIRNGSINYWTMCLKM